MSSRKVSPIWEHFEKLNATKIKCKICGDINAYHFNNAKKHLIIHHKIYDEKDLLKWKNDTYLLRRHFSREEGYITRCKLCGRSLKNAFRRPINRHMNLCHEEQVAAIRGEIVPTWLSQNYTFENSVAYCKLQCCRYKVKIFEGIDVLKSHLKKRHNIDKYSGCEERTEDNNADRMLQQSVDEENYAGPSSHQDNTHGQSFENQQWSNSEQQGSRTPYQIWRLF